VPPDTDLDEAYDEDVEEEIEDEDAVDGEPEPGVEDEDEDAYEETDDWPAPEVLDDEPPAPTPPASAPTPPRPPRNYSPPPVPTPAPAPAPHAAASFEPPAEKKRSRGVRLLVVAVVLVVVAALVGGGTVAYRNLRDDGVDYSKLKVGDCFDSSTSTEVRGVKVKPCAETHNSEIFFLVNHPAAADAPYPGKDSLVQFAADTCLGQPLTEYLGVPLEQSKLKDFEIVPQESAWKDGRRVLVCGLDTGGDGTLTGSVKGTRR
jgi:hypothetical protein